MKLYSHLTVLVAVLMIALTGCNDDNGDDQNPPPSSGMKGNMTIKIDHVWAQSEEPFALNQTMTHPMSGEELSFTKLRYYISNIQLHHTNGTTWSETESYHLVDMTETPGLESEVTINDVPTGEYVAISYLIGVDSLRNVSGAQEGALDPAEAMCWAWNTGYIFIKAEGVSNASANGTFTYHLGGFLEPHSSINEMYFEFQGAKLEIIPEAVPSIHLVSRVARFWHGGLSTAETPMVHMPGETAATLAENFAGGVRFDHIHN